MDKFLKFALMRMYYSFVYDSENVKQKNPLKYITMALLNIIWYTHSVE